MYDYQMTSKSTTYGGSRVVLTGTKYGVSSGRYKADLTRLPDMANGIIPAGTPIKLDDTLRTVDIHYAFEVIGSGSTANTLRVKKGFEGSRLKDGMILMVTPSGATATGTGAVISGLNRTNADYDEFTCAALTGATSGQTLVEATATGATATIKVLPNAFTFYDVVKDPNATYLWIDGLFIQTDGVLLTNRIPPISSVIKTYMADPNGGNVYMRYSTSKE
jgi:hypothetical protein